MNQLRLHGIYRHYKGDKYIVEDVAIHSETGEELVIYRALYGNSKLYVRPKKMFLPEIEPKKLRPGLEQKYRFEWQNIKSVVNWLRMKPIFIADIIDVHTSKGSAINKFCEMLSIPIANYIAIDDDANDISMFQACGYNVAMQNALPKLKTLADYITLDNDHDRVAHFVLQKLLV